MLYTQYLWPCDIRWEPLSWRTLNFWKLRLRAFKIPYLEKYWPYPSKIIHFLKGNCPRIPKMTLFLWWEYALECYIPKLGRMFSKKVCLKKVSYFHYDIPYMKLNARFAFLKPRPFQICIVYWGFTYYLTQNIRMKIDYSRLE